MQSLSELIEKIKKVNLDDYKKALEKEPISKQAREKDWYFAKQSLDNLTSDWQSYLTELVNKGAKSTTDSMGICTHFLVNEHEAELNVKLKDNNTERVCYILYNKKRTACYVRELPTI